MIRTKRHIADATGINVRYFRDRHIVRAICKILDTITRVYTSNHIVWFSYSLDQQMLEQNKILDTYGDVNVAYAHDMHHITSR